jgi:hypothetical protein
VEENGYSYVGSYFCKEAVIGGVVVGGSVVGGSVVGGSVVGGSVVGGSVVGRSVMGEIVVGGFVVRQIRSFFRLKQSGPLLQPEAAP